ncbi:MAG: GTP pyrophosphokinase [Clostridiales bacterium]|nr:GTP pyrophosphokinase [Clostridiales bacterium]
MIYTPLTKKALLLAWDAHLGQWDKSGLPYIFHPYHLAEQMEDELSCAAALLHDVVEDTGWTLEELELEGFPAPVLEALALLTHAPGVPYLDYVRALSADPIARAVKVADLRHNSDLSRLEVVTEQDRKRVEKYQKALALLERSTSGGATAE